MATTWQALLIAYLVLEWVLRVVMLFFVPHNRRPSSATAWILLIMVLPVIGAILFAMFGNPRLPKNRRDAQAKIDKLTQKELETLYLTYPKTFKNLESANSVTLAKLSHSLGGLPPMHGNTASFYTGYQEGFDAQLQAVENAKKYIHIEFFIFVLDSQTEPLFVAIEKAVARGVVVRVLFDRFASARYPKYRRMLKRLRTIGADAHPMLPYRLIPGVNFTRPDLRNHRKIIIVDGSVGFSGSQNMVIKNYHRSDNLVYEELVMKITGPAVWQLDNVFRADWYAETKNELRDNKDNQKLQSETGAVPIQVVPSGPSHIYDNNVLLYASMFHAAKTSIRIVVPYFIPDDSVMIALTSAAQRGVKVTMINSEAIDKLLTGHAQRSYYNELLQAGVEIYLYNKPVFLHTKQVIIDDDMAVVGSSNLDIRSFELSLEANIVLYEKNVVSELKRIEQNYIKKAHKLTVENWNSRPVHKKLLDNFSRLTASLQ